MSKLSGNIKYLDKSQTKKLENLFKRKVPANRFFTFQLLNTICKISREIYKQIGVIIDRRGNLQQVIIGNEREILWPTFYEYRLNRYNLRGISAIHTHLHQSGTDYDDLTDLAYLRLDFLVTVQTSENGLPLKIDIAKISPEKDTFTKIIYSGNIENFNLKLNEEIEKLENKLKILETFPETEKEKVLLVVASNKSRLTLEEEMDELSLLTKAANYHVVDKIIQRINKINPALVLGKGKFKELIIKSISKKANKIIFYNDLTPAQAKSIANFSDLEVIDRTTLILNIFARRANTREGKLKVELAKLKYMLPRVSDKAESLSRIRGGIGLKGPGETAAEVEKRRIKNRIKSLEKELQNISKRRDLQRSRREKRNIPVVSIIGYTNAGKSTLLNTLTSSNVFVENLYFATLDTYSRKMRLSSGKEIIINDTVGFIKNLPEELFDAFKSTIEELTYSQLLIHIVDITDINYLEHIKTVEQILTEIGADNIPKILVFNKVDKIDYNLYNDLIMRYNGIAISAKNRKGVLKLLEYLDYFFEKNGESSFFRQRRYNY